MPQRRRITAHEKRIVAARAGWKCEQCGEMLDETFEADHVVPLHRGGADDLTNLQALCPRDHRKKTMREEIERIDALRRAATTRVATPPLSCVRCGQIVSPYFRHSCDVRRT